MNNSQEIIQPDHAMIRISLKELPKVVLIKETGRQYQLVGTKARKVLLQALEKRP